MNSDELNHPFFIYPRGFMSEYNYYELYRTEVKKLNEFVDKLFIEINEQQRDKEVLVSLIVGSAMEERLINSNTSINNYFQYHQLFPNYINNFIENNSNNKFIQIIIVSPDNIFMSPSNAPYFTLYEPFDFVLTNPNEYILNIKQQENMNSTKQPKKEYTPIKSYKPSGNFVYDDDVLHKIENKFI
jgi:hypothetical protein